jgi:hypothetical protein
VLLCGVWSETGPVLGLLPQSCSDVKPDENIMPNKDVFSCACRLRLSFSVRATRRREEMRDVGVPDNGVLELRPLRSCCLLSLWDKVEEARGAFRQVITHCRCSESTWH